MTRYTHDVVITPAEIRQAWGTMMNGENPFSSRQRSVGIIEGGRFTRYRSSRVDSWIGATGAEILHRLTHGYDVEGEDLDVGPSSDFVMATPMLDDEQGDLLVDQVLGGEDLYRVQWEDVAAPRSITIRACITFAAISSEKAIGEYLEWLLKLADACQRRGVIPSIELWMGIKGGLVNRPSESVRIRIPLVEAGEMVDVTSWRAYLTPGAFRSLGIFGVILAGEQLKLSCTPTLGAPTNRRWNVSFADNVLDVECPARAEDFPTELMNEMLENCGI